MPADVTVRRAEPAEADLVGALTERVYRTGGFGSDDYATVLRDGRSRVRDGIVLVAAADGAIAGTVTLALPGTPMSPCPVSRPIPSIAAPGGLLLVFTQYLQFVLGYSPGQAGLAFVPLAVGALVGNMAGVKLGATGRRLRPGAPAGAALHDREGILVPAD